MVQLLRHLWGEDQATRLAHFKWKHVDNPYAENPLGIVALHRGEVAGFRGYFAARWRAGRKGRDFILLNPGDTVVSPDHRNKGLSLRMGHKAAETYAARYPVFLNTSCSPNAAPGYRKLGFYELAPKFPLVLYGKEKKLKDLLPQKLRKTVKKSRIYRLILSAAVRKGVAFMPDGKEALDESGGILVADKPRTDDMLRVAARENEGGAEKIKLFKDASFFRWRFLNNRKKYLFFFSRAEGAVNGYLVLEIAPHDTHHGKILDYAECGSGALAGICRHILRSGSFNKLSIISYGLDDRLLEIMRSLGFTRFASRREALDGGDSGLHLLVRPVKQELSEADWHIGGLDIRDFANWEVRPICDDGA